MHRRVAIAIAVVLVAGTVTGIATGRLPRPGTDDNGLTENKSATLWSRDNDSQYITNAGYRQAYGENRTAVQQVANGTDLTFKRPPATAATWTRNDHAEFTGGNESTSLYPPDANLTDGVSIVDAHATVFAVTPGTKTHSTPNDTQFYVAPNGTLRGVVDYRIRTAASTGGTNRTAGGQVQSHRISEVRLIADGKTVARADDIVARLDSFTEVSPSGTGIHVLLRGELPEGRNRHGDVELYDTARFFTVTGEQLPEPPKTTVERQDALKAVHADYVAPDDQEESADTASTSSRSETPRSSSGTGNNLDDGELLNRAMDASNGGKFERLWRGTTSGYESQSEADMAFCSLLAFWTGGDATQMDRLVRESGLIREKWDEVHFADGATYGERTIERAIAGTDEFYTTGSEWSLFDEDDAESPATGQNTQSESSKSTVDTAVISKLETEVRRLEDENERLREELTNERSRRKSLEQNQPETGLLHGLRQWLRSVFTS